MDARCSIDHIIPTLAPFHDVSTNERQYADLMLWSILPADTPVRMQVELSFEDPEHLDFEKVD